MLENIHTFTVREFKDFTLDSKSVNFCCLTTNLSPELSSNYLQSTKINKNINQIEKDDEPGSRKCYKNQRE